MIRRQTSKRGRYRGEKEPFGYIGLIVERHLTALTVTDGSPG